MMMKLHLLLTRHVGKVHHHVCVLCVREVDSPPRVHERLQVRVAVSDHRDALPRHHAHVTHQLRAQLNLRFCFVNVMLFTNSENDTPLGLTGLTL